MTDRGKPDEQSVGRGAAGRVVLEVNVDWRRPGQRGRSSGKSYSYSVQRYSYSYSKGPRCRNRRSTMNDWNVYRLSIDYVAFSYGIAKGLTE